MKWVGHIPSMVDRKNMHRILVGKSEGKGHMGNLEIDENITYLVLKLGVAMCTGQSNSADGQTIGPYTFELYLCFS
jgi:hypothetical protein